MDGYGIYSASILSFNNSDKKILKQVQDDDHTNPMRDAERMDIGFSSVSDTQTQVERS